MADDFARIEAILERIAEALEHGARPAKDRENGGIDTADGFIWEPDVQ